MQHDEAIAGTSKTRVMTSLERRRQSLGSEAYAAIFEHTTDGVLFTIPDGTILAANESACALLDLTEEEICAAGRRGVADGSDPRWGLAVAERGRVGRVMAEARMRRGDGSLFEAEITSATFTTADGEPRACVIFRNISARLAHQDRLLEAALVDDLTGLHNRRSFNELAEHQISVADRDATSLNLLYADVDAFKEINDSYGHDVGDQTLQEVARLLRDVCRSSDVVARLGGDEFAVLVRDATPVQLSALVERITETLAANVTNSQHPPFTLSIGVGHHEPGQTLQLLMAAADRAMYAKKQRVSAARAALRDERRRGRPGLRADNWVTKAIARVRRADLGVVDDIGLPVSQDAAEGPYRLVDGAHEKRSLAAPALLGSPDQRFRAGYSLGPRTPLMGSDMEGLAPRRDASDFQAGVSMAPADTDDGSLVIAGVPDPSGHIEGEQDRSRADRLAAVVEFSGDCIISSTLDGTITSWNRAAERLFGYTREEIIGQAGILLSPKDRVEETGDVMARVGSGEVVYNLESFRVRKDGTVFPVSVTVAPIRDAAGVVIGTTAIPRDVTEQMLAAQNARSLTAAEDLVQTVMGSASIGIALAGLDGFFHMVNQGLCDILGFDEAWFLAHQIRDMAHPDDVEAVLQERVRLLAGFNDKSVASLRLVRADGATVWVRHVVVLVPGGDGKPNLIMLQLEDVTVEHQAQEALAYQAIHDPLTGLHNHAWILDILEADLRLAKREGTSVGTLFIDLDNFKVVNDSLGHAAGDEVLKTVATRIFATLRPSDRVGRFGGDEFVIVVQDIQEVGDVERFAARMMASIAADLHVQGHRIVPTASIGIAMSSSTSTPDSLLRDADSALFRAKSGGRGRWQFFDDAMHAQAVVRLTVEDQLRDAIGRSEFVVYYQPIVALADAHVVGHEALVRWLHPTRGLLGPGEFLDVAEDSGLITAIGTQVLDQVCALLAERPDLPGPVSVNVSAVQLGSPDWLSSVTDTLTTHQVDPSRLVIEVTETAALSLTDTALQALESLSGLGVGIHLDDFGTGYSSISVLRDLPVTGVKLDLRFVHDLTNGDSQANALAHGLCGLVNGMHLTGIAEGIETEMQAHILRDQGWECGQGYYFARPAAMPVTNLPSAGPAAA
ncbi:MAG: diguanylate cyclase [Actinomycetota bacterium]